MAYERVSRFHPDKIADRIGGSLVDLAYTRAEGGWANSNPRIAGELTLGHQTALVILETDADITPDDVRQTVQRISGIAPDRCHVVIVPQDPILAANQRESEELRVKSEELSEQREPTSSLDRPSRDDNRQGQFATATHLRCGDNGIFRGTPMTPEQRELTALIKTLDERFHSDAKAVLTPERLTVCQSNATSDDIRKCIFDFCGDFAPRPDSIIAKLGYDEIIINPLGDWTGGLDTDTGAVNRKLGSDMGDAVTGGGIHFKDLSKADVSVNIVCHMLAQQTGHPVTATCSIGDEEVTFVFHAPSAALGDAQASLAPHSLARGFHCEGTGTAFPDNLPAAPDVTLPFADIVERARLYVHTQHGSFEHMAEYGLIS